MKMGNLNSKGFVLAETLIVTVFLMIIFTMIYRNFYPLIGEYEKRENYNDIDGIYGVYWIKRLIEESSYSISSNEKKQLFNNYGYVRFECSDFNEDSGKKDTCIKLLKNLEIEGCDNKGDNCDIFITRYQIGYNEDASDDVKSKYKFKNTVATSTIKRSEELGYTASCSDTDDECNRKANRKLFPSGFKDYVNSLPNYTTPSLNGAEYRVIAIYHHKRNNNNYYSYATIEVNRK